MPVYEITSPDGKTFDVTAPDGASEADVMAYAQKQFQNPVAKHVPVKATDGMSGSDKFFAGVGKGMTDLARGVGQRVGLVSEQDVAEARARDADLMDTGAGFAGNVVGGVTAAAPAMFVPGANSVAGAALVGGALGAAQPTVEGESVVKNAATGAALGGAGQWGFGKLADVAGKHLAKKTASEAARQSQNSVRDATLAASKAEGYVVPPSQSGAGVSARVLEGLSGKYKTNQAAQIKNQDVTDMLARKAIGLADDAPITPDATRAVRDAAYASGYEPIVQLGAVPTDKGFQRALDSIVKSRQGAANSFPGAVKNDVAEFVDALRVQGFDAGEGLQMTRILREEAGAAFRAGDNALGNAKREASDAILDQIDRRLAASGKNGMAMLKEFRKSRTLMAKAHDVEDAIVEGSGHVDAMKFASKFQKGKPLTDELERIGAFANNYKAVAGVPKSGDANPITVMDAFATAMLGAGGAGMGAVAWPAARMAARSAILGKTMQNRMGPSYGPGMLTRNAPLALRDAQSMAGLFGLSVGPEE